MTKMSFNAQLRALNPSQQLLMSTALCTRMLPNHQLWWQQQHEEPAKLPAILDTLWEKLAVPKARIDFAKQQEKLLEFQPDTDQDDSLGAFLALDSCMALDMCLGGALQADDELLPALSRLSRASVTRFIEVTEPDFSEPYAQHPLMAYEFETQHWLLSTVASAPHPSAQFIKQLKQQLREEGISNIGIEL